MFAKQKAAEYFVVAWVKDWTLRTYLDICAEGEKIEWADAHKYYAWLPHDEHAFIMNSRIRRWTADVMRNLNDKLWDAADGAARLKLAPLVEKISAAGGKLRTNEARKEMAASRKALAASTAMNNISITTMRKGNGSHWATCK